jgi:hypothetical protein
MTPPKAPPLTWCDRKLGLDGASSPTPEETETRLSALSPEDLVLGWRETSAAGLKDETPGIRAMHMHFDGLGHRDPDRALSFIEALLEHEPDDAIVALVGEGKLLGQLLHFHGGRVARRMQEIALRRPRLRWLMGSVAWSVAGGMVEDKDAKRRLLSICDAKGFEAWRERERAGRKSIDFSALSLPELARAWVEITSRSPLAKESDGNATALYDFQEMLVRDDPLAALDLVKAILRIEDNANLLALLAAGLLEDLIPANDGPVVDAVIAEAASDPKFRHLLGGVWLSGMSTDVSPPAGEGAGRDPLVAETRSPPPRWGC